LRLWMPNHRSKGTPGNRATGNKLISPFATMLSKNLYMNNVSNVSDTMRTASPTLPGSWSRSRRWSRSQSSGDPVSCAHRQIRRHTGSNEVETHARYRPPSDTRCYHCGRWWPLKRCLNSALGSYRRTGSLHTGWFLM
jgi:hypothetical protein